MIKYIFRIQIIVEVFYKLILSFWVCVTRHVQSIQKVYVFLQYLQKSIGVEVDLLPAVNAKVFYKLIASLWACVARHAQSTQNNKFVILYNISR